MLLNKFIKSFPRPDHPDTSETTPGEALVPETIAETRGQGQKKKFTCAVTAEFFL